MELQLPTSFGLPFFIRVLPGIIGGYLIVHALGLEFALETELLVVATGGLLLGILLMSLDVLIFTLYEGRAYLLGSLVWRNGVKYRLMNTLNRKIDEKYNEDELIVSRLSELRGKEKPTASDKEEIRKLEDRRGEIWEFILSFPVKEFDGESRRTAVAPTRLGNTLLEAELYPETTYSMDVAFYWYRLRNVLPDVAFNTMDEAKAVADFFVYLSFFLIFYTPLHFIGYLIQGETLIALLGCLGLPVAYLLYRLSLSPLSIYGKYFKAAFDNYRSDLARKMGVSQETLTFESQQEIEGEKEMWRRALMFLQYQESLPSIKSSKRRRRRSQAGKRSGTSERRSKPPTT